MLSAIHSPRPASTPGGPRRDVDSPPRRPRLTVTALAAALRSRDPRTWRHGQRVLVGASALGRRLGLDGRELRELEIAALLHDVGKLAVPAAVLRKPGSLTASEREMVERHPHHGWSLLRRIPGLEGVARIVLHHHERVDGRGYPAGLRGDEIPLGSRIIAVADALDAMRSDRAYRASCSRREAARELRGSIGAHFDGLLVRLCLEGMRRL